MSNASLNTRTVSQGCGSSSHLLLKKTIQNYTNEITNNWSKKTIKIHMFTRWSPLFRILFYNL